MRQANRPFLKSQLMQTNAQKLHKAWQLWQSDFTLSLKAIELNQRPR